jgi:hypothetical protein
MLSFEVTEGGNWVKLSPWVAIHPQKYRSFFDDHLGVHAVNIDSTIDFPRALVPYKKSPSLVDIYPISLTLAYSMHSAIILSSFPALPGLLVFSMVIP